MSALVDATDEPAARTSEVSTHGDDERAGPTLQEGLSEPTESVQLVPDATHLAGVQEDQVPRPIVRLEVRERIDRRCTPLRQGPLGVLDAPF